MAITMLERRDPRKQGASVSSLVWGKGMQEWVRLKGQSAKLQAGTVEGW